jgi:hypothetical protein
MLAALAQAISYTGVTYDSLVGIAATNSLPVLGFNQELSYDFWGTASGQPTCHQPSANSSGTVDYQQTTLIVYGVSYARETPAPTYSFTPGFLMVAAKPGQLPQVQSLLNALELKIIITLDAVEMIFIEVPCGFEMQWIAALSAQPNIAGAYLNQRYQIATNGSI